MTRHRQPPRTPVVLDLKFKHRVQRGGWGADDYEPDEGVAREITAHLGADQIGSVQYNHTPGSVRIRYIEVSPEHRRKGIGTALLRELERRHSGVNIETGGYTDDGEPFMSAFFRGKPQ